MIACLKSPLFLPSLLYFCFFAVAATSGRFISLFFLDKGLNDAEVGFILGSGALASLLSKPLLGYFADTRGSRICLLGGAIMSSLMFLTNLLDGEAVGMSRFHWILLLWVARTPWNVAPVLDAFTVKYLAKAAEVENATSDAPTTDKAAATAQYGRCRLWGAVSWATTNLVLGVFMDECGIANVMYIACIVTTICFVGLVCVTVPSFDEECKEQALALSIAAAAADTDTNEEEEDAPIAQQQQGRGYWRFLRALFSSPYTCAFFFVTLCQGMGSALVENLVFLYFREHLHASSLLCGVSVVITVSFEIPLFAVSTPLLERVGVDYLLVISMVCYVVRVFVYTLIPKAHPGLILLVEPMHGLTFACFTMASVQFIAGKAPPGLENSAQTLLATVRAVGSIAGTAGAGYLFAHVGALVTYRAFAGAVTIALGLWLIVICTSTEGDSGSSSSSGSGGSSKSSSKQQQQLQQNQQQYVNVAVDDYDEEGNGGRRGMELASVQPRRREEEGLE